MNDIEIRSHAAQAAATCAQSIGQTDPVGFIRICTMIEAYIKDGEKSAMEIVNDWGTVATAQPGPVQSPQPTSGTDDAAYQAARRSSRAQSLADSASLASDADVLQGIIDTTKKEELSTEKVKVGNISGPLGTYLNNRWSLVTAKSKEVPLNERNKASRADLGL